MKKMILVSLFFLTSNLFAYEEEMFATLDCSTRLNSREMPDMSSKVIQSIPCKTGKAQTRILLLNTSESLDWAFIYHNNSPGWVSKKYLKGLQHPRVGDLQTFDFKEEDFGNIPVPESWVEHELRMIDSFRSTGVSDQELESQRKRNKVMWPGEVNIRVIDSPGYRR